MTYKPHVSGLQLRAPIFCTECSERYRPYYAKSTGDTVGISHPKNNCGKSGTDITCPSTTFLFCKPLGEGIPIIQLPHPNLPNCPECLHTFTHYKLDALRVTYMHGSDYIKYECDHRTTVLTVNYMVFV